MTWDGWTKYSRGRGSMERQRLRDGVNANIMIKSAPLSKSTKCLKFLQSFCRVNTFRKPLHSSLLYYMRDVTSKSDCVAFETSMVFARLFQLQNVVWTWGRRKRQPETRYSIVPLLREGGIPLYKDSQVVSLTPVVWYVFRGVVDHDM